MTHIWLVISTKENNLVLSAHSDWKKAREARAKYVESGEFGNTTDDYWISSVPLDEDN